MKERFKDWKDMKNAKEIMDYSVNQFKNLEYKRWIITFKIHR
ncbi:MAG: hypothetical protein Lokiarch_00670 [Candidatus Lokiarchaeum sp. GC14_75]|nr:MAG: hypothetical protein Lokiarch_00670 [Candidatus Lokiarchaeum sp. GC14_75]